MKGSVTKKGNMYYIVIDLGRDHRNKRRQKWFSGYSTKKEAEEDLPNKILELRQGYVDPENMTFEEYMNDWLKRKKNSVSHGTWEHYEAYTRVHIIPGLGHWKISKLEQHLIDSFVEEIKEKDLAQNTKLHIYRILASAIKSGKRYGLTDELLEDIEAPRVGRQEIKCWTQEEVLRFTSKLKSKNHKAPIMLALATGMRYGEVVGLQWSRVDFDNKKISVTHQLKEELDENENVRWTLSPTLKTETSYRTVDIDDATVEMLKEHKRHQERNRLETGPEYIDTGLVCSTTTGDYIRPTYMRTVLHRTIEKAGVTRITFHGLRHTHATLLLTDGIHPKIVQERLGHGSVQITLDTYSHIIPGIQEVAALSIGKSLYGEEDEKVAEEKEVKVHERTITNNVIDFAKRRGL